jgi:Flp pilus assembly protein CpaB
VGERALVTRRRLAAASVAAMVAVAAVWVVAGGGRNAAPEGGLTPGSGGSVVSVVRVTSEIPRGTPAEQAFADGSLEVVEVSADDPVVVGAVGPNELVGTVATRSVPPVEVLTPGAFATPDGQRAALAGRLPTSGHTALAITLDATRAAGGWLQPGDRVNLLVPGVCPDEGAAQVAAAESGGEVRCRRARYLYQAVDVLAVGAALGVAASDAGVPAAGPLTVVLSLPPRAAQWVASWENELTLALVPPDYIPRVVDPLPVVVGRLPGEELATLLPGCADPSAPGPEGEAAPCPTGEGAP